ncbi:MAG: sugar ABC transporter permease, partial [Acetatifactor sp.]|nr:sugar ABC transporter permease [Acetatifactor sp.]
LLGVWYLVLFPTGDVLRRSFVTALSGQWVGLDNYRKVLGNEAFRLAVGNTLRFLGLCLPLLLTLSLLLALVICRIPRLERFKALYLLPMAIPAATVVLVWRLIFSKQGFLNAWLGTHVDFMGENTALVILVGSYVWKNLGYTMVLWLAGLKAIPAEQTEAARVDGAGRIRCFFQITLPNLKGSAYTITVLSLLNAFKSFREAYLVSGAYPQQDIYLLQHLFQNWYTKLDMDKLAAGAVLMALVLGALSLLLQRLWNTVEV